MRSNILKLFQFGQDNEYNTDNSNDNLSLGNNDTKSIENCLGCDIFNSVFLLIGGSILSSGSLIRKDPKLSVSQFNKLHPLWWRRGLRFAGVGVLGLGVYRTVEWIYNWKLDLYPKNDH